MNIYGYRGENASDIQYINSISGLESTNVNSAIDELSTGTCWEYYKSLGGYPLIINSGTTSQLINDGLDPTSDISQGLVDGGARLFDIITNKITPENIGDSYIVGLRIDAKTSLSIGGTFELNIDIGLAEPIYIGVLTFSKGSGITHHFDKSTLVFTLGNFVGNGGVINLTSLTGNTTVLSFALLITRIHKRKVF